MAERQTRISYLYDITIEIQFALELNERDISLTAETCIEVERASFVGNNGYQ